MSELNETNFKSKGRGSNLSTRIKLLLFAFFSLPKTLYFNFKVFSFPIALKLPVLISYRTKIIELKRNSIIISSSPKRFNVKIGFGGSDGVVPRKGEVCFEDGHVTFQGKATFAEGIALRNAGEMVFGDNFFSNRNCTIWGSKKIVFGSDVLLGWNITFRDSDGHLVIDKGESKDVEKEILIGNHCWICSESHVLKGSSLGNDCILGYRSLLVSRIEGNNLLVVGQPARAKKEGVNWVRGE